MTGARVPGERLRRRYEPVSSQLREHDQRVVRQRADETAADVLETVVAPEPELQRAAGPGTPDATIGEHVAPAGRVTAAAEEPEHREHVEQEHQGPVGGRGRRVQIAVRQLGQPGRAEQRRRRRRRHCVSAGRSEEKDLHEGPAGPRARAVQDAQPPGGRDHHQPAVFTRQDGQAVVFEQRPLVFADHQTRRRRSDQPERDTPWQQG